MKRQKNAHGFFAPLGKVYTSSRTLRTISRVLLLSLIGYVLALVPVRASSPGPAVLVAEPPVTRRTEMTVPARDAGRAPGTASRLIVSPPEEEKRLSVQREAQVTARFNWAMPAPPPQFAPASQAVSSETSPAPSTAESSPAVDYSAIPHGYDCAGTQAVLEVADTNYPELVVVFVYPNSGDPLLEGIWQHFVRHGYVAMTHEDNQDTRLFPCAPNCQFWNAAMLRDRGYAQGSVSRVMAHERVHNIQAANDAELAIHVNLKGAYGPRTQQNWNYQALIEGHAELTGGNVGPPSYDAFEAYYREVQSWAEANGHLDLFDAAVIGHWDAFLQLMELYEGR